MLSAYTIGATNRCFPVDASSTKNVCRHGSAVNRFRRYASCAAYVPGSSIFLKFASRSRSFSSFLWRQLAMSPKISLTRPSRIGLNASSDIAGVTATITDPSGATTG